MRKLAILAALAMPVSALGAYALAASADDPVAPDSRMTVNETQKDDLRTADEAPRLTMEDSDEDETKAGPIRSKELAFDDDDDDDHDEYGHDRDDDDHEDDDHDDD